MLKEENAAAAAASLAWESTVRRTLATKRGGGVFCMSSLVAHVDDDGEAILTKPNTNASDSDNNILHIERLFPSGDFYTGDWSESHPTGTGKYLWTDGCMYEGEWVKGNTAGKGKFSWPSGATFEGEFNRGYMDGFGTYTGCTGETYKGFWVMNLKHGSGHKSYANGDYYEGSWRFGAQEGQGRYVWKNGNEYIGEWKKGVICGKGSLLWANGNRYEGHWEDGLPKGYGIFTWADGSCYVGTWSKDPEEQSGTYYPSASSASPDVNLGWDQQVIFTVDLNECRVSQAEKMSIMPSQKTFHWPDGDIRLKHGILRSSKVADSSRTRRGCSVDGVAKVCSVDGTGRKSAFEKNSSWELDEDITGDIVDGNPISVPVTPVKHGREDGGLDAHYKGGSRQQLKWQPREVKKQGETISKGHKNYELMLNLQLGIRHSVARPGPPTNNELRPSAFDPKEKVWTKFPPEGSKHTPPHQSVEFKWKDYCPLVFRYLRRLFKIDAADYMLSLCGNDALRELSSPGKSGSFFYLTHDDRYMIKTMKKAEVKVLLRMLPSYYNHVRTYENTLVTKFFGLHCVKLTGANQKKVRFVIMGNLFCSEYITHRRFDLKGSSHGRTTDKPEAEIDGTTTLKDLDLNFLFRLQKSWFQEFHRQVDRDCEFLEAERIMDYSLLVGLHFKDSSRSADLLSDGNSEPDQRSNCVGRLSRAEAMDRDTNWRSSIRLGVNMPARVEQTVRRSNGDAQLIGDATGDTYNVILFVGIIDILQDYDISKKLEHAYKSIQYDATSISAVDPRQYSKRFRDFIYKIFIEDT